MGVPQHVRAPDVVAWGGGGGRGWLKLTHDLSCVPSAFCLSCSLPLSLGVCLSVAPYPVPLAGPSLDRSSPKTEARARLRVKTNEIRLPELSDGLMFSLPPYQSLNLFLSFSLLDSLLQVEQYMDNCLALRQKMKRAKEYESWAERERERI